MEATSPVTCSVQTLKTRELNWWPVVRRRTIKFLSRLLVKTCKLTHDSPSSTLIKSCIYLLSRQILCLRSYLPYHIISKSPRDYIIKFTSPFDCMISRNGNHAEHYFFMEMCTTEFLIGKYNTFYLQYSQHTRARI